MSSIAFIRYDHIEQNSVNPDNSAINQQISWSFDQLINNIRSWVIFKRSRRLLFALRFFTAFSWSTWVWNIRRWNMFWLLNAAYINVFWTWGLVWYNNVGILTNLIFNEYFFFFLKCGTFIYFFESLSLRWLLLYSFRFLTVLWRLRRFSRLLWKLSWFFLWRCF